MPIYKTDKKTKDGIIKYRVRVNYTDSQGNHRSLTRIANGYSAAKELELILTNQLSESPSSTSKMSLSQLIVLYQNAKKYEIRETSLNKSISILNNHVKPLNCNLNQLTKQKLINWKYEIEDKNLSFTMKKNIYTAFRALLNWAVSMEYIDSNPLTKVGNFRNPYQEKKEPKFYTPEEYIKFAASSLKLAEDTGYYDYYVFFSIAYYTGARKGEINALRWTDYDGKSIKINKSISQKVKGFDRETPPKNMSSNRTILLPKPLIKILNKHYKNCKEYKDFNDGYHICGGYRALRDSSLSNMNFKIAADAGVKHIRIHDFRHSHASLLANSGINILEISRRLGHSNIEQTLNTYSHFYPSEEDKALKILDKVK